MSLKGWPSNQRQNDGSHEHVTIAPVRAGQNAIDVIAHSLVALVAADAVEALSTVKVINATAHVAQRGDIIAFTSGALSGIEVLVLEKTANAITLVEDLPSAPVALVTFDILRRVTPRGSSTGVPSVALTTSTFVKTARIHNCATDAINDSAGAWVEVGGVAGAAALPAALSEIAISCNVGQPLELGTGANAGAVTSRLYLNQGEGPAKLPVSPLHFAAGTKIWLRSLSAAGVAAGYITLNGIG